MSAIVSNSATAVNPDISVATDQIAGAEYQKIKLSLGNNGEDNGTISSSNPIPITTSGSATVNVSTGELVEVLEAIRMALQSLNRTIGMTMPDTAGRSRILVDQITGGLTLSQVTTVAASGNASYNLNDAIPSLMHLQADNLRRNITVS
jgi:hypothetical protein